MNKWLKRSPAQSRNPAARRQAVASDPLESLGQALHDFARSDSDAGVRKAALQRAADLDLAQSSKQDDVDAQVREAASRLYRDLLAGTHDDAPPLAERLRRLADIHDRGLLEHLCRQAAEAALREAALRKLDRPGLTLERLLADPDRELRLRLLDDIQDPGQLRQIIDRSHRRDKQLHRQATARLHAIELAAGDSAAIRSEAEQLCRQLEGMPGGQASEDAIDSIDQRWRLIGGAVDPVLKTRYDNARAQSLAAAQAKSQPATAANAMARKMPRMDEPQHPSAKVEANAPEIQKLAAENRFQASLEAGRASQPKTRTKNAPAKKNAAALLPMLEALETALDAGNLGEADKALRQLQPRQKELPGPLASRWHVAQQRLAELKRWQQWSSRRQRRQLCVEARAMRGSTQHPEAIANRIRDLRQTWSGLDALEPSSGRLAAADAALKRRFNSLCQAALEPTREWFERRNTLRAELGQRIEALLQADNPDDEDWKALAARRRQLAAARRDLDKVEPRRRKSLVRRLGRAIGKLDEPLDSHYQQVSTAHERLIAQAQALMELEPGKRTAAARALQDKWKAVGPGRRDLDTRQWRAFRDAMDAVFAERERAHKQHAEEQQLQLQRARQLVDELQTKVDASNEVNALRTALREASDAWRQLHVRDKTLTQRFEALRRGIDQRARELDTEKLRQRYRDWLASAENGQSTADMPAALRSAADSRKDTPADSASVRELLVQMEALAGIDSPEEDHDMRMQINLKRLQASLGEGRREHPREQLESQLARWTALGPVAPSETALQQRFASALEAVLKRIQ